MLVGTLAVAIGVLGGSVVEAQQAEPVRPAQPVVVTNDPSQAVPVAAAQEGPWDMRIVGTPTVSLEGTPEVKVTNFPATGAPRLWQGTPYVESIGLGSTGGCRRAKPVPAGHVLFLERVVALADVGTDHAGDNPGPFLTLKPGGAVDPLLVHVPVFPSGDGFFGERYVGTLDLGQPVRDVEVCHDRSAAGGIYTLLGYVVADG